MALNPADAVQGVIDFTTPLGMAIDKKASKALHSEKFNGKAENLQLFLKMFQMRGREFGWFDTGRNTAIGNIAQDPNDPLNTLVYNAVDYYGSITRDEIIAHAVGYLFHAGNNPDLNRARQDDHLAFRCLYNSLDTAVLNTVMLKVDKWMIENPANEFDKTESAILFLRTIIEESSIQTNATTSAICTRLASLNEYIIKIRSDVDKFNQYVEENVTALTARGEDTTDLLVNLWKAYKVVEDRTFSEFMKRRHEQYEIGDEQMSPKELMNYALTKFKLLKEAGEWKQPTEEEKTILALKAQVSSFEKAMGKRKVAAKAKNDRKHSFKNSKKDDRPKEMKSPPDDVNKVVNWRGRPWYWCSKETGGKCEGKWRAHSPKECKGKDYVRNTQPVKVKAASAPKNHKKGRIDPALQGKDNESGEDTSEE